MEFLLRLIMGTDLEMRKICSVRMCDKMATHKVQSKHSGDGWDIYYFAGWMCDEHIEVLEELFPVTTETLSKVQYR